MISLTLASALDAAWCEGRAIPPPRDIAYLTLDEAYEVQDAVVACRESAGLIRSGWKLGLTSTVKQRLMHVDRPVFGRTFADGAIQSGGTARRSSFIAPRVEPELAFGLSASLEPDYDPSELLRAVAWVAPALEITDSRYESGTRTPEELVADNTSAAGYVLGPRRALAGAPPLDAIVTEFFRNGTLLAAGTTAEVLGDPVNALRLLAIHVAERKGSTRAGDIVLSGAITDAFPAAAGDRFEGRFSGFETVAVTFA
jgi:2-keto-4-pentenoate hydratase